MIPPPPTEDELSELQPDALSAVSVEAFPIERVTDDELAQGDATSESAEQPAPPETAEPKRGRGRKPVEPRKKVTRPEEKQGKGAARKAAPKTPAKRSRRRGEDEEPTDSESALQFQRVTDEDVRQDAGEFLKDAMVQEKIKLEIFNPSPSLSGEWAAFAPRQKAPRDSSAWWMRLPRPPREKRPRVPTSRRSRKTQSPRNSKRRRLHPSGTYPMWCAGSTDAFNPGRWAKQARRAREPVHAKPSRATRIQRYP